MRYVIWLLCVYISAAIFQACEWNHEENLVRKKVELRHQISQAYGISEENWDDFDELVSEYAGLPDVNRWNFNGSVSFTLSVATTIGWGTFSYKICFIIETLVL